MIICYSSIWTKIL